ncbi:MAG: hypoxanthine phosphoribosyltransferase [Synergistaceae bacterium]|nr:hypoxanthine phosphoribosyltransferase [Synergistaceae bacterium]
MSSNYKIGGILISEREICERVRSLAERIASDTAPGGDLLVVGILNGAAIFLSDLARHMPPELDVRIDFMAISSYGDSTQSSGAVRIVKDLGGGIEGKDVLIVEDIIDTGLTLSYLIDIMLTRKPARLRTCVLLDKHERRERPVEVDYCGFQIPDAFVAGYGLDCGGKWRHLPAIHVVELG